MKRDEAQQRLDVQGQVTGDSLIMYYNVSLMYHMDACFCVRTGPFPGIFIIKDIACISTSACLHPNKWSKCRSQSTKAACIVALLFHNA